MQSIYLNLDSMMSQRNIDYLGLATETGIKKTTMYRRMKGVSDWRLWEVFQICEYFDSYDIPQMFATKN